MRKLPVAFIAIITISGNAIGHLHNERYFEEQRDVFQKESITRLGWPLLPQQLLDIIETLEKEKSDLEEIHSELTKQMTELSEKNDNLIITISEQQESLKNEISAFESVVSDNFDRLNTSLTENQNLIQATQTQTSMINDNFENLEIFIENSITSLKRDELDRVLIKIAALQEELAKKAIRIGEIIHVNEQETFSKISELDQSKRQGFLYVVFGFLSLGILALAILVITRKKISANQSLQNDKINSVCLELKSEAIRIGETLTEAMGNQLELMKKSQDKLPRGNSQDDKDHSLILKMADEVVRIEKNLRAMDENTRGLKQLSKAVERIKANFSSNAYEIVDMIGKKYDDGMKLVVVNFLPDSSLASGEEIISKVIKPQVNYKGKMIQFAKVEVSQGD